MFQIDRNNLPIVLTRKALLVIDLQNDIVSTGGLISVETPAGFVGRSLDLAATFRKSGNDVIWVRSVFEGSRPVNNDNRRSESVITDRELAQVRRATAPEPTSRARASQRLVDLYSQMIDDDDGDGEEPELDILSGLQLDRDKWDGPNDETFLTLEPGQSAKFVLPGTPGAGFTPLTSQSIDNTKDMVFQKSYYSAFKDGTLVQTLRAKFVTEIYLCGALTNISIFATAMDAARYGYTITIIEDCNGYASKDRHDAALMKLTEFTGCDIVSSDVVIQYLLPQIAPQQSPPRQSSHRPQQHDSSPEKRKAHTLSNGRDSPSAGSSKSRLQNAHDTPEGSGPENKKREKVKTKIKARRRPSKSSPPGVAGPSNDPFEDTAVASATAAVPERAKDHPMVHNPSDVEQESAPLCEGDTTIISNLLNDELSEGILEMVRNEVLWQKMSHRGGDVPRLIAVQGDIAEDGSMPIYRHPADEAPPLLPFSPAVSQIRAVVEKKLGHPLNHVLIQFYRDGNDYISEHSDKTLDIVPNTFIANVSLGAQRTMVFRTKKDAQGKDVSEGAEVTEPRKSCRAPLPHNSMCKMGLVTNMRWLHGIRQDKRNPNEKSEAELAFDGGRISLTFRLIGTFIDKDEYTIWGQGATGKTREEAKTVINGETPDAESMVRAFGNENHSSEFDWEKIYGGGFDVLHILNSPKLFLSGDLISDLGVKIMLAEYDIDWVEGNATPSFLWKDYPLTTDTIPENRPIKFVDNDVGRSTADGDVAIMHYIDTVYGPKGLRSRGDIARQFTRMQKGCELLNIWRGLPQTMEEFKNSLDIWESFMGEGPFLAGSILAPVDFAIIPLLLELKKAWPVNPRYGKLDAYIVRMIQRDSVIKVAGSLHHLHEQNTASAREAISMDAEDCWW